MVFSSLARFFSWVLHPLFMPLITFLIANELDPLLLYHDQMTTIVALCLVINIVAPGIGIWVMIRRKIISDAEVSDRTQRAAPYLLVIFYFACTYVIFRVKHGLVSDAFMSLILAVPLSLLISLLINRWWKISVHALAQGGVVGAFVGLSAVHSTNFLLPIALFCVAGGVVAASRVYLKLHTHSQVYAGFALGLIVNWFLVGQEIMI